MKCTDPDPGRLRIRHHIQDGRFPSCRVHHDWFTMPHAVENSMSRSGRWITPLSGPLWIEPVHPAMKRR